MRKQTPLRSQGGFTLIEVLVAILIVSIGLLGLVGLQARAIQYSVGSEDMTRATRLVDEVVWAIQDQGSVPLRQSAYDAWVAKVADPANGGLPMGEAEISAPDGFGVVRITVTWLPPDSPAGSQRRQYVTELGVGL